MPNRVDHEADLVVIGGGPGGYVAAIRAAQLGIKTILVEKAELGGVCLNWGCIPTKTLLHSADVFTTLRNADRYGLKASGVEVDFPAVVKRSRHVASRLSKGVTFLMKKNGIKVLHGRGRLAAVRATPSSTAAPSGSIAALVKRDRAGATHPGARVLVEVVTSDGSQLLVATSRVIIATGARTRELPGIRIDGTRVIGSKQAMTLNRLPKSVAVVGGGSVGVEFAHMFHAFGSKVTLFEVMPTLLPTGDEELSRELEKIFRRRGLEVFTSAKIESIQRKEGSVVVSFVHEDKPRSVETEYVLLAVGVVPNSEDLGLEQAGVETCRGWIQTDDFGRTTNPAIYAVGDVAGQPCLAHCASAEGVLAVEHIAGRSVAPINYDNMPTCTYCNPQVASVGLTEKGAIEAGYQVKVGRFPLSANGRALAMGESHGFVKVVVDSKHRKLLGLHIIGPEASELLLEFTLARTMNGTCEELLSSVHPHPTLGEAIYEAVGAAIGQPRHL